MAYTSLREFMERLEKEGRLKRVSAPVSPNLEITEIQTRLLAEQAPRCCSRMSAARTARRYPIAVLANLFGTVERVAWGMEREPHQLRESARRWPSCASRSRRAGGARPWVCCRCSKTVMTMKPRTVRKAPVQEVVLTGDRDRPVSAADPDLLAGRAGAADHLAAGGDQGARQAQGRRLQPRHLPHAGDRPEHHPDALAASIAAAHSIMRGGKRRANQGQKPEPLPAAVVIGADPALSWRP